VAQSTKSDFSWGGFFGGFFYIPKKTHRVFWVCTRVSEPWSQHNLAELPVERVGLWVGKFPPEDFRKFIPIFPEISPEIY